MQDKLSLPAINLKLQAVIFCFSVTGKLLHNYDFMNGKWKLAKPPGRRRGPLTVWTLEVLEEPALERKTVAACT